MSGASEGLDDRTRRRVEALERDRHGRVVPWFVARLEDGPDHRVVGTGRLADAVAEGRCWVCGQTLGAFRTYVVGPMCAVSRVSSEPPSHRGCAEYAATVCPFLTTPRMRRREQGLPEETSEPGGIMSGRNPGVVLLWTSRATLPRDVGNGVLFDLGDPVDTAWWCQGRLASRDEVLASLEAGWPVLAETVEDEGPAARRALAVAYAAAVELAPTGGGT